MHQPHQCHRISYYDVDRMRGTPKKLCTILMLIKLVLVVPVPVVIYRTTSGNSLMQQMQQKRPPMRLHLSTCTNPFRTSDCRLGRETIYLRTDTNIGIPQNNQCRGCEHCDRVVVCRIGCDLSVFRTTITYGIWNIRPMQISANTLGADEWMGG